MKSLTETEKDELIDDMDKIMYIVKKWYGKDGVLDYMTKEMNFLKTTVDLHLGNLESGNYTKESEFAAKQVVKAASAIMAIGSLFRVCYEEKIMMASVELPKKNRKKKIGD